MRLAHSIFLGILTGALLCASHGFWAGLSWLAPIPLLYALVYADVRSAFYTGLLCGFFESLILFGLSHGGPLIFITVALVYALSRALFCVAFVSLRDGDYLRLLAPALWVFLEWGQAQLPMTLPNLLGDTFDGGDLFGVVRLGGTYLLSGLVVWAAAIAVRFIREGGWQSAANQSLFYTWLCCLCVCQLVGTAFTPQIRSTLSVSLVQGGIPTWMYVKGQNQEAWEPVSESIYTRLTQEAAPSSLTIWPETAVDQTFVGGSDYAGRLEQLSHERGALLLGSRRQEAGGTLYNSAIYLSEGSVTAVDKQRLAMVAESHFTPGPSRNIVKHGVVKLGIIFCLESVMPSYANDLVEYDEADVLVVLADGSRFGNTLVGEMHARRSVLRAVESGRSVMHVGQHGFTHVVSALGERSEMLPPFVGQTLSREVEIFQGTTPFHRIRHLLGYGLALMVLVSVVFKFFRNHQMAA